MARAVGTIVRGREMRFAYTRESVRLVVVYVSLLGHPARKAGAELHGRLDPARGTGGPVRVTRIRLQADG